MEKTKNTTKNQTKEYRGKTQQLFWFKYKTSVLFFQINRPKILISVKSAPVCTLLSQM